MQHANSKRMTSETISVATWVALGWPLMCPLMAWPLTACSGDAGGEHGQTLVTSESGALLVTVSSEPAERPVRGSNRITFYIESTSTGEPVDDLELVMTPFMPAHGHGNSQEPSLTPLGDGSYRFDDVLLSMAGLWEFRTTVSGPMVDYFAPRFEVE